MFQAVHDAEDLLERCKIQAEEARKKLQMVIDMVDWCS